VLKTLIARARQGHRTMPFPKEAPTLPDRFRGLPRIDTARCQAGCRVCADVCPTDAIAVDRDRVRLDLGRCLFCPECEQACPEGAIHLTGDYRLSASDRKALALGPGEFQLARAVAEKSHRIFGRSLKLRQVSAGGCNGCEADVNVLTTVAFDLGRFGIQFVASPRHADGLLVTGPVTRNMAAALRKTYEAVPPPKWVIAVGACAISGGPYHGLPQQGDGIEGFLPVNLYVPGCPPHPLTILDGLLRLLGKADAPFSFAVDHRSDTLRERNL
jgi:Ni,Fe-hydrogenase III small subunit/Pyruvate/2-oxoacid:ferredoxin oxidoreductase delta subunit